MKVLDILLDIFLYVFVSYFVIYCFILFIGIFLGLKNLHKNKLIKKYNNEINRDFYIPVSIILPAYNEEVVIIKSVESLINLNYRNYEIIVVDDGSTDNTCNVLIKHFKMHKINKILSSKIKTKSVLNYYSAFVDGVEIILVKKENGKKADSINAGINISKYGYFITMDADTILPKNSVEQIIKPIITYPSTIAVGGCVKLVNNYSIKDGCLVEKKKLPSFLLGVQEIIYDRNFLSSKFLFDSFNGNLIISGAYGIFKKELVVKCGGYNTNTVGEDMELVLKLHKYCMDNNIEYSIKYNESARCYTQAPSNIKDFTSQQKRWYTGLIQSLSSYSKMMLNFKYGKVSFLSFSYTLIFELLSPIIETVGLITMIIIFAIDPTNIDAILFLLSYIVFCSLVSIAAFMLRIYNENFQGMSYKIIFINIVYSILENFGFRQYMNMKRFTVLLNYNKNKHAWKRFEREAI